jgi:ABC-type multidrug transport system ATPase subunit
MTSSAIAASGLRKAYGDKTVLDSIDLNIRVGTVFSLLGPNGAGKTTTVNVLTTLLKADGGTARVAGHDIATEPRMVRAAIGVTGQFAAVDDLLTGEENLQLMADLHHLRAGESKRVITSLLERFDLVESAQKMASTYSGGMRRKLDLAMTLVTRPQIIFLDEPTTGLDPRSRRTMWDIVRERAHQSGDEPFPHRVQGHQLGQLRDQLRTPAEADLRFVSILHGREAQPLEPGNHRVESRAVLQADVLHDPAAPQFEGSTQ